MRLALLLVPFALPFALSAQLIPAGQPVPLGPNPPVVFLNGYQLDCSSSSFSGTFGSADTVLQASQIVTLFFDNCTLPNSPSIETLGVSFGQFLAALKYTDGTPVTQVDVVAHSMGGLIVRSYLAGKQNVSPAAFSPPANPGIRKAIFLATPHFGTGVASAFGFDTQTTELSPAASSFSTSIRGMTAPTICAASMRSRLRAMAARGANPALKVSMTASSLSPAPRSGSFAPAALA